MTAETGPKTTLGLFDISCVVVGGIIGVGIFFTPSEVAKAVDSEEQVIVAWSLGAVVAIFGALVFAQLGRLVHGHGGIFVYIHDAFGPLPAFLYGWCNWLVIQSGAVAVVSLIVVEYFAKVLGGPDASVGPFWKTTLGAVSILVLTAVNILGLRLGKGIQNTLTVIKTLAVFALVALPLVFAAPELSAPVAQAPALEPNGQPKGWWAAMALAILPVLFSFGGWQHGSFLAGAARKPARDVPLGILFGVLVVVVAYITVNLAFLDMLGLQGARDAKAIAVDGVNAILAPYELGEMPARVMAAMIVISALGVMNTICMAPPYVLHAMARQNLFLQSAAPLHARFGTPAMAILVQGVWAVVLLVATCWDVDQLNFLLSGVVFVDWLFYGLCGLALLKLRRVLRVAGSPFGGAPMAVLFALMALAVTAGAIWTQWKPTLAGIGVLLLGVVVFFRMRRPQAGSG